MTVFSSILRNPTTVCEQGDEVPTPNLTVATWTARIVGSLILLLILAFAIGEGVPNPLHGLVRRNPLTFALVTMMVGLVLAWKWEGIGGLLILGGLAFVVIVNHGVPACCWPWDSSAGTGPGQCHDLFFDHSPKRYANALA